MSIQIRISPKEGQSRCKQHHDFICVNEQAEFLEWFKYKFFF